MIPRVGAGGLILLKTGYGIRVLRFESLGYPVPEFLEIRSDRIHFRSPLRLVDTQ